MKKKKRAGGRSTNQKLKFSVIKNDFLAIKSLKLLFHHLTSLRTASGALPIPLLPFEQRREDERQTESDREK
jgi:hypothetical protein